MSKSTLTQKRYSAERRFRALGVLAIAITGFFLAFLLFDIATKALPAFTTNEAEIKVMIDPSKVSADSPKTGDFNSLVKEAWRAPFPDVSSRGDRKKLNRLLSPNAADPLQRAVVADPALVGKEVAVNVPLDSAADMYLKGYTVPQIDAQQANWLKALQDSGSIKTGFSTSFFTNGDSREPDSAGIRGALIGSILTILVTLQDRVPHFLWALPRHSILKSSRRRTDSPI
jgi:phosphate transport system permease protein